MEIAAHLAKKPLDILLQPFRDLYSLYYNTPCDRVFGNPKNIDQCRAPLQTLFSLFTPYAKNCFDIPIDAQKLHSQLQTISSWMMSFKFDMTPFEPVANLILNHASDLEIWNSLMQLVDELVVIMSATDEQLDELATESIYRRVVESHDGVQMNMEDLKQAMSVELDGSVFVNVIGFWNKYFESERMKKQREGLIEKFVELSAEPEFKFPTIPTEGAVWKWMQMIEHDLFKAYRTSTDSAKNDDGSTAEERFGLAFTGTQFHTLAAGQIIGNQSKRQVDYFIKKRNLPVEDKHHWRDILVVGELTVSSSKVSRQKFLQLSLYMREVFMAQPLRRFVHGFILFENDLQLWVYDRSGPYSCSYIDIGKSPKTLVHVLVTYMLMNDDELGLDPKVKYEGEDMIVHLQVPGSKELRKFTLDPVPISQQKAYLCRGTTCYRARDLSCVVKFSWRNCDGHSEIELLEMADNISGMAQILGSLSLVKISKLRDGLRFTKTMVKDIRPTEKVLTTPHDWSGVTIRIPKESVNNQLSRKRKKEALEVEKEMAGSNKKARSMQENTTDSRQIISERLARSVNNSVVGKRKTVGDAEVNDRMKRIQLSSNTGLAATSNAVGPSTLPGTAPKPPTSSANIRSNRSKAGKESLTKPVKMVNTEIIISRDRQFTAAGISPYGRPIDKFRSALELIVGMCDAIKAHRLLVIDANILHRDISVNNILLTGINKNDKLGGILIDLDLATLMNDGKFQEKAQVMTGTMQFIALDILENSFATTGTVVAHSYRHDLESFLYVLVWVCINCGWKKGMNPHGEFLSKWYIGTAREIHRNKLDDIKRDSFNNILCKFSPMFEDVKGLVKKFRELLFLSNIETRTGSLEDPNKLYGPIIAAFDRAIHSLKE
ncbi:serine/threonine-protein kinase Sgk2 [Blumeria hordei DH14]|uniref:non-specific serine/threonine protein kinase n=1 Tax=Blumeria graminis f. sp. hordei (strain DH14) TaxID=546991 RepID=N1JCA3_BLUG1|nr:serine/threonine-protein kinase Sgk2 [Blumeria hordei DH14]